MTKQKRGKIFDWIRKRISKNKKTKPVAHSKRWRYDTDGITKIPVDD